MCLGCRGGRASRCRACSHQGAALLWHLIMKLQQKFQCIQVEMLPASLPLSGFLFAFFAGSLLCLSSKTIYLIRYAPSILEQLHLGQNTSCNPLAWLLFEGNEVESWVWRPAVAMAHSQSLLPNTKASARMLRGGGK